MILKWLNSQHDEKITISFASHTKRIVAGPPPQINQRANERAFSERPGKKRVTNRKQMGKV